MNKESQQAASRGGVKFSSLLGLTFIVLKLCHVITWSWLWVLAPFWIPIAILIIVLIILLFVYIVDHVK